MTHRRLVTFLCSYAGHQGNKLGVAERASTQPQESLAGLVVEQ
ncbi:MAG: hypothetical protein WBP28_00635 [Nostocoides sp.]